jgi:hypothetical protein
MNVGNYIKILERQICVFPRKVANLHFLVRQEIQKLRTVVRTLVRTLVRSLVRYHDNDIDNDNDIIAFLFLL